MVGILRVDVKRWYQDEIELSREYEKKNNFVYNLLRTWLLTHYCYAQTLIGAAIPTHDTYIHEYNITLFMLTLFSWYAVYRHVLMDIQSGVHSI